jgi:hypothetical protein
VSADDENNSILKDRDENLESGMISAVRLKKSKQMKKSLSLTFRTQKKKF